MKNKPDEQVNQKLLAVSNGGGGGGGEDRVM